PASAYSAIWPGPGRPARSGRTPEATPVVRTVLMSRVPVYLTVAPVCSSHGLTISRKASCSLPPHVPITVTVAPRMSSLSPPPPPSPPQAVATRARAANGTSRRSHDFIGTPSHSVGTFATRPAEGPVLHVGRTTAGATAPRRPATLPAAYTAPRRIRPRAAAGVEGPASLAAAGNRKLLQHSSRSRRAYARTDTCLICSDGRTRLENFLIAQPSHAVFAA